VNSIPFPASGPAPMQHVRHDIDFVPAMPQAHAPDDPQATAAEVAVAAELVTTVHKPISQVMDEILWTVHAEDHIDRVEEIFAQQGLTSAPVVGSNGAIVGMLGAPELLAFHAEGKNPKAVQAWEISRIRLFEVGPDDTVEDVAKLMTDNALPSIAVTEFGRLKGVVSEHTLLQEILHVLPDERAKD
jgi:CBS domain-containing protein